LMKWWLSDSFVFDKPLCQILLASQIFIMSNNLIL
jgi:hypothetical protein